MMELRHFTQLRPRTYKIHQTPSVFSKRWNFVQLIIIWLWYHSPIVCLWIYSSKSLILRHPWFLPTNHGGQRAECEALSVSSDLNILEGIFLFYSLLFSRTSWRRNDLKVDHTHQFLIRTCAFIYRLKMYWYSVHHRYRGKGRRVPLLERNMKQRVECRWKCSNADLKPRHRTSENWRRPALISELHDL